MSLAAPYESEMSIIRALTIHQRRNVVISLREMSDDDADGLAIGFARTGLTANPRDRRLTLRQCLPFRLGQEPHDHQARNENQPPPAHSYVESIPASAF